MACARSLQCTPRIWCDLPPAPLWIVSVHSMEFWSNLHASEVMKITLTWWINHTCIWKSHLHDATISNFLDYQHMTSMSVSMTITWHQWHKPFIQAAASGSWAYAPISQGVAGLWASWYLAGISHFEGVHRHLKKMRLGEHSAKSTQCQVTWQYTLPSLPNRQYKTLPASEKGVRFGPTPYPTMTMGSDGQSTESPASVVTGMSWAECLWHNIVTYDNWQRQMTNEYVNESTDKSQLQLENIWHWRGVLGTWSLLYFKFLLQFLILLFWHFWRKKRRHTTFWLFGPPLVPQNDIIIDIKWSHVLMTTNELLDQCFLHPEMHWLALQLACNQGTIGFHASLPSGCTLSGSIQSVRSLPLALPHIRIPLHSWHNDVCDHDWCQAETWNR